MNTKHCAPLASLALAITALLAPATGCDINVDDSGGDTGGRGDDDDGDDDDDDDDGNAPVDVIDGDDDGDDGSGPGSLDGGDDAADGGADGGVDDGGFDDGGFDDDGGGNAGACESYCQNELTCDELYPDMDSCMADCGESQSQLGTCVGIFDQLNTCLGGLSCDDFLTYWNALAILNEGQDPGQFPCMNELGGLLECAGGQGG